MKNILALLVAVLVLTQCSQKPSRMQYSYAGPAQGSTYSVLVMAESDPKFKNSIDSILYSIDLSMSLWKPNSLLSKINRGDTNVFIDENFYQILELSQNAHIASKGLFDPTIGPLASAWGFGNKDFYGVLDSTEVDSLLKFVGFSKVNFTRRKITMPKGMKLDFNAVAQGYTVDVIAQFLLAKGYDDFMVEVGGELITHGVNSKGKAWTIGIDKPATEIQVDRFQAIVNLSNKALATSGNYRKFFVDEATGEKYVHTILPNTGYPVKNNLLSVTVIADNCGEADAMATALMVMGLEDAKQFLTENSKQFLGLLIYSDEKSEWQEWYSPEFEKIRKS